MDNNDFKFDSSLFLAVLLLLAIGVVMVYSASSFKAQERYNDSHYFLKNHFYKVVIGLVLMLIVAKINYRFWLNLSPVLLFICSCTLIYILVSSNVTEIRGSKRWLNAGFFNFQPSDFARMGLILFLSLSLGHANLDRQKSLKSFALHMGIIACIVVPILCQPDIGSAILIAFIAITILFITGEKLRHLFVLALAAIPFLISFVMREGYQKIRILKFLAALKGEHVAWQTQQSLIAFGNGNILGLGLGSSRQKYHFLPDPFTDFIFAIVGEELGLIGTTMVLVLFVILIWSALRIAMRAPDFQGRILGIGITLNIAVYAFTNMGVVVNLLPTTGIPMPFLSYGGSALIVNLFGIGLLLNIAEQSRQESRIYPVGKYYHRRQSARNYA